jgi:hypothetical protein
VRKEKHCASRLCLPNTSCCKSWRHRPDVDFAIRSENKSREQEDGVIAGRVPSGPVIVCLQAMETQVTCVLYGEIDILFRPPGQIQNITITAGISVQAAGNRSLWKKNWVGRSIHTEQPHGSRKFGSVMIFNVALQGVQVMAGKSGTRAQECRRERSILANVTAPQRESLLVYQFESNVCH